MSARSIAHTPDHGHWTPAVPLSGVVAGRILLAILEALVVGIAVAIWSALTHTGLSSDQITGFTILATAVCETLDAASMRLTMRIQRADDMNRVERAIAAFICPPSEAPQRPCSSLRRTSSRSPRSRGPPRSSRPARWTSRGPHRCRMRR